MGLPFPTYFPHRQNIAGSFDTICPRCFAIVANVTTEAEITEFNGEHVCDTPPDAWVFDGRERKAQK